MNSDIGIVWRIDFASVVSELKQKIASNRKALKKSLDIPNKTFANFAIEHIMREERLSNWFFAVSHLDNVKNSKITRKIMSECLPLLSDHQTALAQNEALYAAYQYIFSTDSTLTQEQKQAIELELLNFKLEGVKQAPKIKKRIKDINSKLAILENEFSQNVLSDTNSFVLDITDASDVEGLPKPDLDAAYNKEKNCWRFTLHAPSYFAYMTYGKNRDIREKLYKAYSTRGAKNQAIMQEILSLRNEKAKLLGFANYAELSIASKSAASTSEVESFLASLASKSKSAGIKETDNLKQKASSLQIPLLQSFDVAFVSEILKKQSFDLDEEIYRPYFEINGVVNGVFRVCETLFGVSFKNIKKKLWHPKAKAYEVIENNQTIGYLYLDLEARKGKKSGAWMDESSAACIDENGNKVLPNVYIVCNFPSASKNTPSLLKHSDVETLFHEMGHALHHLLAKSSVASVSGVNGVAWDVVEFPSQFLEQFAYEPEALKLFASHYQTNEILPDFMIEKLKLSRNFQSAIAMLRQLEFALFDLKLHLTVHDSESMQKLIDTIRDEISPLKPPAYNKMQNSFAHIFAGSYAAGYYSYKWAEALSSDAYLKFNGLDAKLGKKFRNTVLAYGGSKNMEEIFKEFMGRKLNPESLLSLYEIS